MPTHSSTPEPQALPLRAAPTAARPPRLLIVEDEADLSALLQLHLSELPAEVSIAADGEQGLSRALTEPWDLIVLDLRLPRLGGLDVCREIRTRGVYIPILMLTARATELDRVLGLELGADDYLTKPFSMLELQARSSQNKSTSLKGLGPWRDKALAEPFDPNARTLFDA